MNIGRTRFGLVVVGTACSLGGAAALVWGLCWPCDVPKAKPVASTAPAASSTMSATRANLPSLAELALLCEKPLQRPLVDATAEEKKAGAAAPQKALPLKLTLLGTVVEPGRSQALVSLAPGNVELHGVGETVGALPGGPEVVQIEADHVVVRYRGELLTVRLKGADER